MLSKAKNSMFANNKVRPFEASPDDDDDDERSADEPSQFRRTFSLLFFLMMLGGIDITIGDSNPGCFRRFYTKAIRCYVIISQSMHAVLNIYELRQAGTLMTDASYKVTMSLIAIEVVLIYATFALRMSKYKEFFKKLEETCLEIVGNDSSSYYIVRCSIGASLIASLAIVVFFASYDDADYFFMNYSSDNSSESSSSSSTEYSEEEYDDEYPPNVYEFPWVNWWYLYQTLLVEACLLHGFTFIFCLNVNIMVMKLFSVLGKGSAASVGTTNTAAISGFYRVGRYDRPSAASMTFLRHHDTLCCLMRVMNDAFTEIFMIWNATELATVIFIVRALDIGHCPLGEMDYQTVILALVSLVTFVTKSACVAQTNEKVMSSVAFLTDVDEFSIGKEADYIYGKKRHSIIQQEEIKRKMYIRYLQVDVPYLTGCGIYTIRKGFILAVAGNAMTYILVLYNTK